MSLESSLASQVESLEASLAAAIDLVRRAERLLSGEDRGSAIWEADACAFLDANHGDRRVVGVKTRIVYVTECGQRFPIWYEPGEVIPPSIPVQLKGGRVVTAYRSGT